MTNQTAKLRARTAAMCIVAGLVIAGVGLRVALSPPIYSAHVVIGLRVKATGRDSTDALMAHSPQTFSPASEATRICSTTVLGPAAEKLGLPRRWSNAFDSPLSREEVLAMLKKRIRATVSDESGLITLAVSGADPAEAAEIANSVAQQYVEFVADSIRRARGDVLRMLKQNLVWQTTAASNLRKRIEEMRAASQVRTGTNAAADIRSPAAARAYALAAELARVEANLVFAETRWAELRNLDSAALREILPGIFPNELLLPELVAELAMIDREIENVQDDAMPENSELDALAQTRNEILEQIEQRVGSLMAAMENELQNLRTQSVKLRAELDLARMPATAGSEQAGAIEQLERELQSREKVCEDLQLQIMREEVQTAGIRAAWGPEILQQADVPVHPVKSWRAQGIALSAAGLALASVGIIKLRTRPKLDLSLPG